MINGWFRRRVPEPRHVRLHVLHEAAAAGDITVDGWQTREDADWVFLSHAAILHEDGRVTQLGEAHVPRHRVVIRQPVVAVSAPLLDAAPIGADL